MRQIKKLTLTGAALAATATAMAGGQAAFAAPAPPAPKAGAITIFSPVRNTLRSPALITGAIGDHGTFLSIDRNGRPDVNGNYAKVILTQGSFRVNGTKLTHAVRPVGKASGATCSVTLAGSAPVPVYDGTGAYAGIHGTLAGTAHFGAVGSRYPSGPKAGQCDQSNSAPATVFGSLIISGHVAY